MLKRLSKRCWYMSGDHETDRPSLGYVQGDRQAMLVDCGNSPAHIGLMLEEIRKAGLPRPTMAVVTHAHWDHVYGMCALDVPVIASKETQAQLIRMEGWQWTAEAMLGRLAMREDIRFCHDCIVKEYQNPLDIRVRRADIVFSGKLTVDLGGCTADVIQLENSHAADCAVISVPDEGVLFTGDITYMDLHDDPPSWHMKRRGRLIEALRELPFTVCVPGHQDGMERRAFFASLDEALAVDIADGVVIKDD